MMTLRGHTVIHYGHEDSDVECSEHVTVLSRDDYNQTYGDYDFHSNLFKFDVGDAAYKKFNARAIEEVNKRKQPGDWLLAFWGAGHRAICDGAGDGMRVCEPGIGYPYGHFAEYKIFESYAMYHAFLTTSRVGHCSDLSVWSKESVIPNYFDPQDFESLPKNERSGFLFVGRIGTAKGIQYAIQLTERLGEKLVVAGQNVEGGLREVGYWPPPAHVEVIGHVNTEQRKKLMCKAKAVICISTFAEPFCGVHVEAMMSGTPVITADWGAFTEFNVHGVTGFRCRTLDQMVESARRIDEIDNEMCRKWAVDNFSIERVADMYEAFFSDKNPLDRPTTTKKVAVWSEKKWALGRIGFAIQKYIPNVDFYDWLKPEDNTILWMNEKWRDYDAIISNTTLLNLNKLYGITPCENMLKRFISISHCPKFNHSYFYEEIPKRIEGIQYAGVSKETCEEMKNNGIPCVSWTPFGVDTELFHLTHKVSGPIQKIGIVGGSERSTKTEYSTVKGFDMFDEICRQLGIEGVHLHSKPLEDGPKMYDGIDLLICCSEFEAGPLGIFEAASCGIPVLCRPVGNAKEISGICTFKTIDDAVKLIRLWNSDWTELEKYARKISHEVRVKWNMRHLIHTHLLPLINQPHFTDISDIPIVYMHTGKSIRKENMIKTLEGFSNVNCYNCLYKAIPGEAYHSAYNKDLINILDTQKLPFIFMEDDCSRTPWFRTKISYPSDADVVYLGNSEWSIIPGEIRGTLHTVSWTKEGDCARVYNMLGMHAVLIISERWRDMLKSCCKMGIHQDVALTRFMKDFNVYALYNPIVYQDPLVGGTQTAITFDSIPPYKGNIEFCTLDFIEIGTADFNSEIQKSDGRRGISVEPVKHFIESLPDVDCVVKVNAAISNYDGFINVYSISPKNIEKYNLPVWLRGCNSVNNYHPTSLRYVLEQRLDEREVFTVDRVPVMTFFTLVKKYNVHGCRYLKIDTEGHDMVVINSYLDCVAQGCGWFPLIPKVQFEVNCLSDNAAIESVLQRLTSVGYEVTYRDHDDIIVELC